MNNMISIQAMGSSDAILMEFNPPRRAIKKTRLLINPKNRIGCEVLFMLKRNYNPAVYFIICDDGTSGWADIDNIIFEIGGDKNVCEEI